MSEIGDDDLANGVVKVVGVVIGLTVGFALIPPEDDCASILVCLRGHDEGTSRLTVLSPP